MPRTLLASMIAICLSGIAKEQASHASDPVSFELDVQPILTATGCNMGACHGKQRGQNGFQLSLLGFDSEFDYASLTRDARGRRLFPAAPRASLLLQKATGQLPHGGGQRFEADSPAYETLLRWIRQGAPRAIPDEPTLDSVTLRQVDYSLGIEQSDRLQVTAHYSDGTDRDVTSLTTYLSNDQVVVSVAADGTMTAGKLPGETAIMARYQNHICVANVFIPQTETLPASLFEALPRNGFIDDLVYDKLQKLSIEPSEPINDATFMRRVYLDLIGRLPSADEAREYIASVDSDKRETLIDELLSREEYVDHWANHWADLLRPNPYRVGIKAVLNYDNWIRLQFREDVSHDVFVRRLVTAKGSTWQNGASTLFRDRRSPDEVATMVSQLFLGIRLECAKCHHHPFERWSQQDFYQFAAFFAKVGRKGTGLSPPISGGEEVIYSSDKGEVKHPLTGQSLQPTALFGSDDPPPADVDPRQSLADWMTSADNDYFAKVQVNRIWAQLMGRGLVEPVDDLRSTNPPSNPELLDALADHFRSTGFDSKQLLKTIVLSRVYSHASRPTASNVGDRINYSRHYRHRLRAEVLMDAIADVTETPSSFQGMPSRSRANQVWTHRVDSMFLDTFGRPNENQDPPCERTPDSTVTQSLHLMNSRELDGRIRSDKGRAARLAAEEWTVQQILENVYLSAFSRMPDESELEYGVKLIEQADNRRVVIEDLMWAIMNSPEFSIQD